MAVEEHQEVHRTRDAGRIARGVLVVVIAVVLMALALDNRDDVPVHWVIGDGEAPGFVVLLVAAVAGAVIGWLVKHRPRHG